MRGKLGRNGKRINRGATKVENEGLDAGRARVG